MLEKLISAGYLLSTQEYMKAIKEKSDGQLVLKYQLLQIWHREFNAHRE